jgi:hypothetical protein
MGSALDEDVADRAAISGRACCCGAILKDFEPVSLVATVEWGLIANNQTSYKTAADLIAAARAAPGKIDYSSGGPGSPQHLAMAMFASAAGISRRMFPIKAQRRPRPTSLPARFPSAFRVSGPWRRWSAAVSSD